MKRSLSLLIGIVLLFSVLPVPAAAEPVTINVYNWGQYISDGTDGYVDVNKAFTEATGIEVNYMTFESNETMYTKLKTGGSTYDVIIPSDYMVARLAAEGMLLELDYSNIPNYALIDDAYKNTTFDPENKYTVPYTWGTVGVIYNKKYVDEADIGSWDLLWNSKYSGKILMFNNPRDAFAISELLLGMSINTEDEDELRSAAYKLIEQKPLVQAYVMDQIFSTMEHEEAWIAPYYAGDYLTMVQENENLGFYFPEEGFNLYIDAMCIPSCCQHKAEAEAYINFMCNPEIAGENLEYLGYSTPISSAKNFMDPDVAENEIAYPSQEVLSKGTAFCYLPAETNQLMDSLWLEVKTQGSVDSYALICMAVLAAGLAVYFTVHGIRKKKRIANRCKKWKQ